MRLVHILPALSEEASGPSYSVVRLCESLIAEKVELTLAALDWEPIAYPPAFIKTFKVGWGPRSLGRSPSMQEWVEKQSAVRSIDLIHNHSVWMMPNVYAGQVALREDIPLVLSPRGTFSEWAMKSGSSFKRLFWPLIQRPAIMSTTCFHATAHSEYHDIRRLGFRQPVAIIPNGVDIPELQLKQMGGSCTLLFLGRIHPVKGLDLLLPAWRVVQNRFPNWKLRIVGPDNRGYLAQMKQLASDLGLERVEFSGVLYGKEKNLAFAQADLFVLPSYSENFGMTVAEALAAGTAAIVTKGAPWSGLNQHKAGWWIDIGIDPLVACLEDALSCSRQGLVEMGLRGRNWMKTEYSWGQVALQMAQTYRWILHGGFKPEWVIEE